jgi:magnesium transporter
MSASNPVIIEFNLQNRQWVEVGLEEVDLTSPNKDKIYWIRCSLDNISAFNQIAKKLDLQDEIKKLCLNEISNRKILDFDNALVIQVHEPLSSPQSDSDLLFGNLTIYLTERCCLTVGSDKSITLQNIIEELPQNLRFALTPGFILFLILENVVNSYTEIFQKFEMISDSLDDTVREQRKGTYKDIVKTKNQVLKIKRNVVILRDILMRISHRRIGVISEQGQQSLSLLYSRSQMIANEADSIRDSLNGILGFIDNVLMQKINQSIQIIRTIATIFFPVLALTGLFTLSQNYFYQLSLKSSYFYPLAFAAVVMIIVLVVRKWNPK